MTDIEKLSSPKELTANLASALQNLFDRDWYLEQNPEVQAAGIDPLVHYLELGGFEGRDPNPLFDSDWYLQRHPHAALTGLNPLVHYVRYGAAEGRDPHPLFDTDWYVKHTADLPAGINPLIHYIAKGAREGRPPSELFVDVMTPPSKGPTHAAVCMSARRRSDIPKVSIVIPVFNKAPYLSECLNSVLAQSFRDIEVVCVDDGSSDGSQNILEAYYAKDERIVIVRLPHSLGAAIARNIGINCARGAYLQFTDADDVLPATAIEALYGAATSDGLELVRGNLAFFSDSSGTMHQETSLCRHKKVDWTADSELSIPWWHQTYLICRKLVVENEVSYPSLIDGEDTVFVASLLVRTRRISTITEVVYLCRKGGGSRRKSLRHVIDFIRHIPAVRDLYLQSKPEAWTSGYYPFLCSRFDEVFLRNTPRTPLERAVIGQALAQAGVSVAQPSGHLESPPSAGMLK